MLPDRSTGAAAGQPVGASPVRSGGRPDPTATDPAEEPHGTVGASPCRLPKYEGIVVRLHRPLLVIALVAAAVVGVPPVAGRGTACQGRTVQVLAINDFHGRIAPTTGDESRLATAPGPDGVFGTGRRARADDVLTQVGGAANMATLVQDAAGGLPPGRGRLGGLLLRRRR